MSDPSERQVQEQFELHCHERWAHGRVAYEIGGYHQTFESAGETMVVSGVHALRWERDDETWRVARFVIGAAPPAAVGE